MRLRAGVLVIAVLLIATAGSGSATQALTGGWLSYGGGPTLTGAVDWPGYTANVDGFQLVWKTALNGSVVAQPLAVPTKTGTIVIAATETGDVYAIGRGGSIVWHTALGSVTTNGCGPWGVSSTPVVDLQRNVVYVANADGTLHALRLADGKEAAGWPIRVTQRFRTEYVWGGLELLGDRLYVPVASYCDQPSKSGVPAEGGLLAYDVTQPAAAPLRFDPVPGKNNLGGIWGWGGVAIAANGTSLYTGVGNAEPDVTNGNSDSMVQVSSDLTKVLGSYRPTDAAPGKDIDFGAAPVLFQPKGCPALLAANDKDGDLLIWRQNNVGAGLYARIPLNDTVVFVGAPSWSASRQMLFDGGTTMRRNGQLVVGTTGIQVTGKCGFTKRWFKATGTGTQPQPLVAGDLVVSTGGDSGGIFVNRTTTGVSVWSTKTAGATVSPPILASGLLVAGDLKGTLYAWAPAG